MLQKQEIDQIDKGWLKIMIAPKKEELLEVAEKMKKNDQL